MSGSAGLWLNDTVSNTMLEDIMTPGWKSALVAGLMLSGAGLAGTASAMPAQGLQSAVTTSADTAVPIENVRWVCPPYRPCFWAPGFYRPYAAYRPYGFYRPYGWGWHRWHRPFYY
jgi:hypothetical protein